MKSIIEALAVCAAWNEIERTIKYRLWELEKNELETILAEIVSSINPDDMDLPQVVWSEDEWNDFIIRTFERKLTEDQSARERLLVQSLNLIYDMRAPRYAKEARENGNELIAQTWDYGSKDYVNDRDFGWIWTEETQALELD